MAAAGPATSSSPSSAHDGGQDVSSTPQLVGPSPSLAAASTVSRRLPPPCWSHDETVALIDAYRNKWYSLRRGNLRANHWQEVADDVAARCPVSPAKTAVQCRHKMEKLRKRYRAEVQRAAPYCAVNQRYISAWVHFKRMDAMERGLPAVSPPDEEDDQEDLKANNLKPIGDIYRNNNNYNFSNSNRNTFHTPVNNNGSGFRIRLPVRQGEGPPMAKVYSGIDGYGMQYPNPNPNTNPNAIPTSGFGGSSKILRDGYSVRGEMGKRVGVDERKKVDPIGEMVEAIRVMGEGFVRMERMKMDMAREVEEMRMEMEMKRTEMILESQQRIVEAFAKAISEKKSKKAKTMPTMGC